MKTGKCVTAVLLSSVILGMAACGGGGAGTTSGGGNSGNTRGSESMPNRGLNGTLYFYSNAKLRSVELSDPKFGTVFAANNFASSVSLDGSEFIINTLVASAYPYWYRKFDIFRIDGPLLSSFTVGAQTYGAISLSPDNQLIAVGHQPRYGYEIENVARGLRIWSRDGELIREFLDGESGPPYHSDWAWTHDGRLLLSYASEGLYMVDDVRGSQPRLLRSFDGKTALYLDVSPDDTKIAFTFFEKEQAFVMNMDGTGLRQLTESTQPVVDNTVIEGLSWSPDGNHLALVASQPDIRQLCFGLAVLIVKAEAEKVPLPELVGDNVAPTSNDIFYPEIWDSERGMIFPRPTCPQGDIDWR